MKIILLTGFLGSGKTTLINHLVSTIFSENHIVVLENESGDVSIDGSYLRNNNIRVVDLKSGCICCSLRTELIRTIKEISETVNPDFLIIESSGLSSLEEFMKIPDFRFDSVLTLLDVNIYPLLMKLNPGYYRRQFALSPVIILTKGNDDLSKISSVINDLNTIAPDSIVYNGYGDIDREKWMNIFEKESIRKHLLFNSIFFKKPNIKNKTINVDCNIDKPFLELWLSSLTQKYNNIIRIKGLIKSIDGGWIKLDYVNSEYSIETLTENIDLCESNITFWWTGDESLSELFITPFLTMTCSWNELNLNVDRICKLLSITNTNGDECYARNIIEKFLFEIGQLSFPKWGYKIVKGKRLSNNELSIGENVFHPGITIFDALKGCDYFLMMVFTVGEDFNSWIYNKKKGGDVFFDYISDQLGSIVVESMLDYILTTMSKMYEVCGLSVSNSFSPGYCDWDTSEQRLFFSMLPESPCGVTLNDSNLMLPVKSISTFLGIGRNVEKVKNKCAICFKKDCKRRMVKCNL